MEQSIKEAYLEGYIGKEAYVIVNKKQLFSDDPYRWVGSYVDPPEDVDFDEDDPAFTRAVLEEYIREYPEGHGISFQGSAPGRRFLGIPFGSGEEDIPLNKENLKRLVKLIHSQKYLGTSIPNR